MARVRNRNVARTGATPTPDPAGTGATPTPDPAGTGEDDTVEVPEAAEGHAVMLCPEGGTGCSHNGETYDADEEGFVHVPIEAVADLLHHGFTLP